MRLSPIREFGLKALLWLPLSFFFWFAFASPLVWPVVKLARPVLVGVWPDLFSDLRLGGELTDATGHLLGHSGYLVELTTRVAVNIDGPDGRPGVGLLEPTLNPLVYGYALPLFAGLVMATPLTRRRRVLQFAIALGVIWVAQAFGLVCESLKVLAFESGAPGAAAVARAGVSVDLIALGYQFGYLILPAVVPIALWIGLNREFIELLVRPAAEPVAGDAGPSPHSAQE